MSGDEDPGIRWQDMLGMSEEEIDAEIDESSLWSIKALAVGREVSGFVQGQKEPSEMYTKLMWCHPPWWQDKKGLVVVVECPWRCSQASVSISHCMCWYIHRISLD